MKGLLLKDAYQAWKLYKVFYLIAVVMEAVSIWVEDMDLFLMVYPFFLVSMIPLNLLTTDEGSKWDVFCGSLPCSRRNVVSGKYLIGILNALPTLGLVAICQGVRMGIRGSFSWGELGTVLLVCVMISMVLPAISLPCAFKFGTNKGRMVQLVLMGVICGGCAALAISLDSGLPELLGGGIGGAVLLALMGLYALSWYLSVRFYEKRDLG